MALLQIQTGAHKGKQLKLPSRPLVIGRGDSADMRIHSGEISREHCRLTADGHNVIVEDLGSSNGTFVNGKPITGSARMTPGDRLTVGPVTFRVMGVRKPAEDDKQSNPDSKLLDPAIVAKAKRISDDDVTSWLSETTPDDSGAQEDTKILNSIAVQAMKAKPKQESEHIFESVAEEAADIIRRHFESLKSEGQ